MDLMLVVRSTGGEEQEDKKSGRDITDKGRV